VLLFSSALSQKSKTRKDPLGVGVTQIVVLDSILFVLKFFELGHVPKGKCIYETIKWLGSEATLLEETEVFQNGEYLGEVTLGLRYLLELLNFECVNRTFGIICHLFALVIEMVHVILQDLDYFIEAILNENLTCQALDKGSDVI
jgi:hypothetical protein